jgi:nucleoside-diphosphate-sugar epimerase
LGAAEAYVCSIHTDDAGAAVAAALSVPAGTYNVGDDEPVTRREHAEALARALGVRAPRFLPAAMARVGGSRTEMLGRSQRVSNRRLRGASGWKPEYPSVREGWPGVVGNPRSRSGDG